jgi:GGDEF domain-containing protein
MTELRRSLLYVALYITSIIALGVLDLQNMAIINFANYFYLAAIFLVLAVLLIPSLHQVPLYSLLFLCAMLYLLLVKALDRSRTGSQSVEVIVLEMILVSGGVWLAYRFAVVLAHSESLMDILAQGTFPSRVLSLEAAGSRIRTEFNRGRRYQRPIALLVLQPAPADGEIVKEILKGLQRDVLHRLHLARIAQVASACLRQTDMLLRDDNGQFIILCPETSKADVLVLGGRLLEAVRERTGIQVTYGVAVFPVEALTFEDLWQTARRQLGAPGMATAVEEQERTAHSRVS